MTRRIATRSQELDYGYTLLPAEGTTNSEGGLNLPLSEIEIGDLFQEENRMIPIDSAIDVLELQPGPVIPLSEQEHGVVNSIRVVDGGNKPIGGALIWDFADPTCWARSDKEGRVELRLREAITREHRLAVGATGYEQQRVARPASATESVARLRPAHGLLQDAVRDAHGNPVEDVMIVVGGLERTAWTDPNGYGHVRNLHRVGESFPLMRSKAGFFPDEGRRLVLGEADAADSNITPAVLYRPTILTGRLVDIRGQPFEGASMKLANDERIMKPLSESGRFRLPGVTNGHHALLFDVDGELVWTVDRNVPGTGETMDLGTIVVRPTVRVSGWVVDEEGQPVRDAAISVNLSAGADNNAPLSNDGRPVFPILARSGDAGDFIVDGLPVGKRIALSASRPGFGTRQSMLVLGPVDTTVTLTMPRMVKLRMSVLSAEDNAPLQEAVVILDPGVPDALRDEFSHSRILFPNEKGDLETWVIPNGSGGYRVMLDGYNGHERNVRFSRQLVEAPIVVRLDPELVVRGVVRGHDGRPQPDTQIQITSAVGTSRMNSTVRTNHEGRFEIRGLSSGSTNVSILSRRYGRQDRTIEVPPHRVHEVELTLTEAERYQLRGQAWIDGVGPAASVQISALDRQSTLRHNTVSGPDGWFLFDDLPASDYTLNVRLRRPIESLEGKEIQLRADVLDWRLLVYPSTEN